jgi:hypothetical protein
MTSCWSRWVLAVGLLCACVDDDPDELTPSESIIYEGDGPYRAIEESAFFGAYGRARVALLSKCCEYIDRPTTAQDDGPPVPRPESRVTYDPAAGAACISQYNNLACPHGKEPPGVLPACHNAFRGGQLQVGDDCASDWECEQDWAEPVICAARLSESGLVRTCERLMRELPQSGEACLAADGDALRCVPPLLCRENNTCALPRLGEPCTGGALWGDTCEKGLVCDREDTLLCVLPLGVGSACDSDSLCELYACIDGVCAAPVWGLNSCATERSR